MEQIPAQHAAIIWRFLAQSRARGYFFSKRRPASIIPWTKRVPYDQVAIKCLLPKSQIFLCLTNLSIFFSSLMWCRYERLRQNIIVEVWNLALHLSTVKILLLPSVGLLVRCHGPVTDRNNALYSPRPTSRGDQTWNINDFYHISLHARVGLSMIVQVKVIYKKISPSIFISPHYCGSVKINTKANSALIS